MKISERVLIILQEEANPAQRKAIFAKKPQLPSMMTGKPKPDAKGKVAFGKPTAMVKPKDPAIVHPLIKANIKKAFGIGRKPLPPVEV